MYSTDQRNYSNTRSLTSKDAKSGPKMKMVVGNKLMYYKAQNDDTGKEYQNKISPRLIQSTT
jgi:hypothetical protein